MLYEIGSRGLIPIDVNQDNPKNSLPIGTVLTLNGYDYHKSIIVKNLGIDSRFAGYGSKYLIVSLADYIQRQVHAFELKYLNQKQDERIQTYTTDEVLSADEVLTIWEKSQAKHKALKEAQEAKETELNALEAKGKALFDKYIPQEAQALIVACYDVNDSDIQSDYFNHKTTHKVILGWSKHKRDIFSEMRKYANRIPETKHLTIVPLINENGKPKTPDNAKWWHPKDEHREKWSMGDGYYLKDRSRHSTGWRIEKESYKIHSRENYISLAHRCVL